MVLTAPTQMKYRLGMFAGLNPERFEDNIRSSWLWKELHKTRNIRPSFNTRLGIYGGMLYTGTLWWMMQGHEPWTFRHHPKHHQGKRRRYIHWQHLLPTTVFLLVYKALHGQTLTCIRQFCTNVMEVQLRFTLRLATHNHLILPRSKTKFGKQSFSVAGPSALNSLPDYIRTSPFLIIFKNRLTTHLFIESYSSWHC